MKFSVANSLLHGADPWKREKKKRGTFMGSYAL